MTSTASRVRRAATLLAAICLSGFMGCVRAEPAYPSYQLEVGRGKTLPEIEKIMGGPGQNMADLAAPEDQATSPQLKKRFQKILKDKPGVTVLVWKERRGADDWIVTVDFQDGKPTGGGGSWKLLPGE